MAFDPRKLTVLETTLRDGSYVIDFQFTAEDTRRLAGALDRLGFLLIEIGHGLGINAGATASRRWASPDVEHIRAAKAAARTAKIGMFCIPGIARLEDLHACIDAGLDFVRIGANVDQVETTASFIKEARRRGIWVCTNFMKSYAMPPGEFREVCKRSAGYGSEMLYLVDSAGGMLPDEVTTYVAAMREATDLPIGFHGHNNLHLGVANSLTAIKAGATIIDTTLLGMGRSSGNPPTEIMVPILQRTHGIMKETDPLLLLDIAEQIIAPMLKRRWEDTTKTALGLVQVHSMYVDRIAKAAGERERDLFSAVFEVGRRDRLNLPDDVLATAIDAARPRGALREQFGDLSVIEVLDPRSDLATIVRVAVKLNVPIEIEVDDRPATRGISQDEIAVRVRCPAPEAVQLLDLAPDRVVVATVPSILAATQPALHARLQERRGRAGFVSAA